MASSSFQQKTAARPRAQQLTVSRHMLQFPSFSPHMYYVEITLNTRANIFHNPHMLVFFQVCFHCTRTKKYVGTDVNTLKHRSTRVCPVINSEGSKFLFPLSPAGCQHVGNLIACGK
ncbi:hypothetical protein ILYODFUR_018489 [Ilyodon furcidens]|uniref:Uncharacterized protein n=1 Tax=Ilyodon furcidens TaxID=33524 RepID=A0ABV0SY65_9TELE